MLDECGEIGDFAVFSVAVDFPELQLIVSSRAVPQGALQAPTRTLLSPPAVASRPFPWGSKWAEYMGAFSLCQDTSSGAAFIVGVNTARGRSIGVYWRTFGLVEVSAAQELGAGYCVLCAGRSGGPRPRAAVRCGAVRCSGCVRRERFAIVGKRHSECKVVPGGNKARGQASE